MYRVLLYYFNVCLTHWTKGLMSSIDVCDVGASNMQLTSPRLQNQNYTGKNTSDVDFIKT